MSHTYVGFPSTVATEKATTRKTFLDLKSVEKKKFNSFYFVSAVCHFRLIPIVIVNYITVNNLCEFYNKFLIIYLQRFRFVSYLKLIVRTSERISYIL